MDLFFHLAKHIRCLNRFVSINRFKQIELVLCTHVNGGQTNIEHFSHEPRSKISVMYIRFLTVTSSATPVYCLKAHWLPC